MGDAAGQKDDWLRVTANLNARMNPDAGGGERIGQARMRAARMLTIGIAVWWAMVPTGAACAADRVDLPLRGHVMALTIYKPSGPPTGTIIMGSGDVGWVGLAVARAQELSADGYVVVGVNVREYLSAFTSEGHASDASRHRARLRGVGAVPSRARTVVRHRSCCQASPRARASSSWPRPRRRITSG